MIRVRRRCRALALATLMSAPAGLHGQAEDSLRAPGRLAPLVSIGTPQEDRLRIQQLLGRAPTEGFLIRSPSSQTPALPSENGRLRWSVILPQIEGAWNSELPFSLNDGAMWAGRGASGQVTTGVRMAAGRVSLILAPQLTYSQNLEFQTLPPPTFEGSLFASPWYRGRHSADLPLRFGDRSLLSLRPGQSTVAVTTGPIVAGASTESQWWGPGIRNAIVMSNHAEGFPHLFLRSSKPLRTQLGQLEGKWILGGLTESLFFDTVSTNDVRSLSGFAATFRPAREPNLTLGVSRVVYAAVNGAGAVPLRSLDVFTRWGAPAALSLDTESGDSVAPNPEGPSHEQILSLFGRWIFPRDGLEVYAEWARIETASSPADLLNEPNHTQGYTLGLQWAKPVRGSSVFRLQSEITNLEESPTFNNRPGRSYYVSASVPQGYTHRGQIIGAAIGPGGSGQWLAGDYVASGWRLGAFGGRIRWNNDVYYDKPGRLYVAHDVSVFGGLRGGVRLWNTYLEAEFTREQRYNYLFQNPEVEPEGRHAIDEQNSRLRFTLVPMLGTR
jgi:hypothetical protein